VAQSRKSREPKSATVDSRAAPGTLESGKPKIENWADRKESPAYEEAARLYPIIQSQYDNQAEQSRKLDEFWHIYHAEPDENQQYLGNSQGYVPVVRDCINARAKRRLKQLFPVPHRHVEAVGTDAETPYPQLALLEHYIRRTDLKSIVRSDLVAGDVTGQWNLYIDWMKTYRRVTNLIKRNPALQTLEGESIELTDPNEEEDALEDEDILEEGPDIVDVATEDVAVIPPTCNDVEKSEASVVRLRMSRAKVRQMIDEGVFKLGGEEKKTEIERWLDSEDGGRFKSPDKARTLEAGIQVEGTTRYLLAYEAACMIDFDSGHKQLALVYYGGPKQILGIIKAPWWGGKRPLISAPLERVKGSFRGISKIEPVKFMQWQLTDFWNMGQDSAQYSLLPIVMTDPLKQPNYASMVIGLSAVWMADPNSTKPLAFPQLYKEALTIVDAMKRQIWESMDVNEMTMGKTPQGRKNNAVVGAMQQEAMIGTTDDAERYEEVMLNPLIERMFEYDCQFRTRALTILTKGELGVKAKMQEIAPQQWGQRYFFRWAGTSFVMGMQLMQQQIATMNVLRGIPPQQLNGRKLDITPIIENLVENVYGPEIAPRVLIDERNMFTIDPQVEDEMMHNNLDVMVHEADDDAQHIARHQMSGRLTGDLNGRIRAHVAGHLGQLQKKREMAMAQAQQGGVPGAPGPSVGGPALPGMAGTPRMGAQPVGPRPVAQRPPGMTGPDQMVAPGQPGRG